VFKHVDVVSGSQVDGFPITETDAIWSLFKLKKDHEVPPGAFEGDADEVTEPKTFRVRLTFSSDCADVGQLDSRSPVAYPSGVSEAHS